MTAGAWQVTETNALERRNLFCVTPGAEKHLATIISGSRGNIDQFDVCVRLIQAVPDILSTLERTRVALRNLSFLEDTMLRETRTQIEQLLSRLGA